MIIMVDAFEVGRLLGGSVRDTTRYREDFVESEDVTDLLLASINRVGVSGKVVVTKKVPSEGALMFDRVL